MSGFKGWPIRAYKKSVIIGPHNLFPLPDPQATASVLEKAIREIEAQAYEAGRRDKAEEIRRALRIRDVS